MTSPDSGPLDRDAQLGRLAEQLQIAIAANEDIEAAALAERFAVAEDDVVQLVVALRVMHESLDEDLDNNREFAPPKLSSDYEVGNELGRGGMGIVYRAHQRSLDRDVAVKVLRPGDLQFGDAMQRFEREAKSLARLRHRHIVSVHEVGKASGFVYFTMDLIIGQSLQQLIADDELTNSRAVKLLRQVASAMTYAHSQGVVHRDLKPANILVDLEDDAFVVDFGLARDLGGSRDEASAATMTGQMLGTPAYMSPEQALGDRDRIGEASDIYALGAVLYECLTGQRPFHGMPLATLMHAVIETDPIAPRKVNAKVPEDLEVICQTAMQKRIDDRYPTVLAMAEDLERFSIGREIQARRHSKARRMARFVSQNRKLLVTSVLPAVAILLLLWTLWLPGVMRDRDLAFAEQLLTSGNDEAALIAYRSAFGELAPDSFSVAARTGYARCLVNQAGRLQLRQPHGFEASRDACLKDAHQLLVDYINLRQRPGRSLLTAEDYDACYEWNRIDAFAGGHDNSTLLPSAESQTRWQRDLTGPTRDATLVFAAYQLSRRTSPLSDSGRIDRDTLVEIVRLRPRLPETIREDLSYAFRGLSAGSIYSFRDRELEADLIALVRDRSLSYETRLDAACLVHGLEFLPFVFHKAHRSLNVTRKFRGSTSSRSGGWSEPVVTEAELVKLVEDWDNLQGLSRTEQYRKRIECVATTLFRERTTPKGTVSKSPGWDLGYWLEQRTGRWPRSLESWQTWWQQHQDEDPKAWLLDALNWDISIAALTPQLILHRFRNTTGQQSIRQQQRLHRLLTLIVPEGIRQPRLAREMYAGNILVSWEQALGLVPSDEHRVRIATLAFVDGSPTPQIIWRKQFTMCTGDRQRWFEWNTPDLERPGHYVGFGRRPWMLDRKGSWFHQGQASMRWNGDSMEVDISNASQTSFHASATGGNFGFRTNAISDTVAMIGSRYQYPEGGQTFVETLSLAHVTHAGADAQTWEVADWLAAIKDSNRALTSSESSSDQRFSALAVANFLPAKKQLNWITDFAATAHETYSELGRRARLMSGDPTALTEQTDDEARHWTNSPTFWMRLALTTEDATIRSHAFEQLRNPSLLPAHARTLRAAHKNGSPIPEWLMDKATAAASPLATLLHQSWSALAGLAALVLSMVLLTRSMWRNRSTLAGRRIGILFWFATLLFAQFTVAIDGRTWNPAWLGFSLNVLASWYICWRMIARWTWIVPALWWTTTVTLHLLGMLPYEGVAWGTGVILFAHLCTRHATSYATAEVRKQRQSLARRLG